MDEVLTRALTRKPEPIVWDEENAKLASSDSGEEEGSGLTAH